MAGTERFLVILLAFHAIMTVTLCHTRPSRISQRADDPEPLETIVMRQGQMIDQLQAELTNVNTELAHLQARLETKVAFSARLSANKHFVDDNILVCDLVELNQGGGYDKTTGVFTAPMNGLYVFSLKITHTPPGSMHVEVLTSAGQIAEAEAEGQTMDRSSSTVAVQLAKGNRVWVQRLTTSTATELQSSWRTLFTGFLVRADSV